MHKSLLCLGLVLPCVAADPRCRRLHQQLAREIYKQCIEIKSGYTTGPTTPVAEAVSARLKEGFPHSDMLLLAHTVIAKSFYKGKTFLYEL